MSQCKWILGYSSKILTLQPPQPRGGVSNLAPLPYLFFVFCFLTYSLICFTKILALFLALICCIPKLACLIITEVGGKRTRLSGILIPVVFGHAKIQTPTNTDSAGAALMLGNWIHPHVADRACHVRRGEHDLESAMIFLNAMRGCRIWHSIEFAWLSRQADVDFNYPLLVGS